MTELREPPTDTRFKPGQSGNPSGRPAGSRSKVCVALDASCGRRSAGNREGDDSQRQRRNGRQAGQFWSATPWPPRKGARLQFDLPEVTKAEELPGAIASVNKQVAEGEMSPEEGTLIVGLLMRNAAPSRQVRNIWSY